MELTNIVALFGGLALFLYGMHMMSDGLEHAAGNKMKSILQKITSNRFLAVLVGAAITAVIQSSSATTVMVVGFVNSQLMTLNQAVWIIMGANIGTTITGQLLTLDVSTWAPVVAIIGVILVTFLKNKKANAIGLIMAGLGFIFIGMDMMKDAMVPLRDEPVFIDLMTKISNPFLAVLVGAGFTALIQSSSASVGVLQSLATSGLIGLNTSIYIIFGQNIGTCITSFLASLSGNRASKRATIIHLSFNLIGTLLFIVLIQVVPFVNIMESITSAPDAQIANTHTVFNIFTTLILLPFGYKLAKLSEIILPVLPEESEDAGAEIPLTFVDAKNIGSLPIAISSLRKEAVSMLQLCEKSVTQTITSLYGEKTPYDKIILRENRINFINLQITDYMSKVSLIEKDEAEANTINGLYKSFSDIERIGDHALNLADYGNNSNSLCLSDATYIKEELETLKELLLKSFDLIYCFDLDTHEDSFEKIERIEDRIDELTQTYRENQLQRLADNKVSAKDTIIYSEILTDIERISDHLMNIIEECKRNNFTLSNDLLDSGINAINQAS